MKLIYVGKRWWNLIERSCKVVYIVRVKDEIFINVILTFYSWLLFMLCADCFHCIHSCTYICQFCKECFSWWYDIMVQIFWILSLRNFAYLLNGTTRLNKEYHDVSFIFFPYVTHILFTHQCRWFMPVNIGLTFLIGGILGWIIVKLLKPNMKVKGLIIASCSSGNLASKLWYGWYLVWVKN